MEKRNLTPFEHWMVNSNLETIKSGKMTAKAVINTLLADGYNKIAKAVEQRQSDDTRNIPS